MLVEAADARALARGMQGFQISAARHLNAAVTVEIRGRRGRRKGQVFVNRYHAEVIDTPKRARHALAYILNNWRRHREHLAGPAQRRAAIDPYSSGLCFDGWRDRDEPFAFPRDYQPLVVVPAESWLLKDGWRRWGPVDVREVPGLGVSARRGAATIPPHELDEVEAIAPRSGELAHSTIFTAVAAGSIGRT